MVNLRIVLGIVEGCGWMNNSQLLLACYIGLLGQWGAVTTSFVLFQPLKGSRKNPKISQIQFIVAKSTVAHLFIIECLYTCS